MTQGDVVAARLQSLIDGFGSFVGAYDTLVTLAPKQLDSHRTTIALRHRAGSVSAAVADPEFVVSLRRTLRAWRVGMRRSRLAGEPELADALRAALPAITALESLRIDADDLPDNTPEALWAIVASLGLVDNDAKIVAGTKALHHLLPDLVPPMDRAWTGGFFGLKDWAWQGAQQRQTFLNSYRALIDVAKATDPQRYVTGEGWRTSRTKIIDNALIAYCKIELSARRPDRPIGRLISFRVPGYPPAKNEARSMLGPGHSHAPRVRALLTAARDALLADPAFTPVAAARIALDVVLHADPAQDPWDATNYLGGIADVLEDKSRRGSAVSHLGDLATTCLYADDRQIKQVAYREETGTAAEYVVTVRVL